jgi:hypothetical protein
MHESQPDANIRSQTYFVARTSARCRHCGSWTRVLALAVPLSHETLLPTDADDRVDVDDRGEADNPGEGGGRNEADDCNGAATAGAWQRADLNAFVFYVERLPGEVQRRLIQLSPFFRLAHSAVTLSYYWANHCEHCRTLLDDHELHCEPDGAFMPSSEAAAAQIELLGMPEPLEALAGGYALEPEFFGFMRKG